MMHLPKDAPKLLEGAQEALLKGKLRIKLSRRPFARTHTPIFSINVQESWRRRDGRPIEYLGKYWAKPLPEDGRKRLELNFERCKYWLGKGAQPTDRVLWLLEKVLFIVLSLYICLSFYHRLASFQRFPLKARARHCNRQPIFRRRPQRPQRPLIPWTVNSKPSRMLRHNHQTLKKQPGDTDHQFTFYII